jgi:hypothetical protein
VVVSAGDFPVDAVYTWTHAPDERERALLARRMAERKAPRQAVSPERFRDLGTIGWSVRALLRFAPWVRTIHVLTSGRSVPDLPADSRIRIVSHDAFVSDRELLPTFNSYAIEAHIGFVSGLAEHFIYFNDDMFLGGPVERDTFFMADGTAVCRFDDPIPRGRVAAALCRLKGDLRLSTQMFSADVARRALGAAFTQHPAVRHGRFLRTTHQAAAARASVLRSLWNREHVGMAVRRTAATPVRGWADACPFTLMAWLACAEGAARAGAPLTGRTVFLRDQDVRDGGVFADLLASRPLFFCLNDEIDQEAHAARSRVREFLDAYFASAPV